MNRDRQDAFQRGVLLVAIIETVYWVYLLVGGLTDQLPFAKGYGEVAAVLGTFVFVPFVLPALVLAVTGRALGLAVTLCTIGGVLYGMDPLYRLTTLVDDVPVSGVFAVGFVVALAGTAVLLTRRKRAT